MPQSGIVELFTSASSLKMSVKLLLKAMFIFWTLAVAVLSVISYPGSNDLLMSVKLTSSGFVIHCIAYFVGMLLCYLAFEKKNISFVLWAGLLIFLFSMILEIAQFYLPYRTFNVYDVVANGVGVLVFVVGWLVFGHAEGQTSEVRRQVTDDRGRKDRASRLRHSSPGYDG